MFSASALGHHSPPVPQSKVLGLRAYRDSCLDPLPRNAQGVGLMGIHLGCFRDQGLGLIHRFIFGVLQLSHSLGLVEVHCWLLYISGFTAYKDSLLLVLELRVV